MSENRNRMVVGLVVSTGFHALLFGAGFWGSFPSRSTPPSSNRKSTIVIQVIEKESAAAVRAEPLEDVADDTTPAASQETAGDPSQADFEPMDPVAWEADEAKAESSPTRAVPSVLSGNSPSDAEAPPGFALPVVDMTPPLRPDRAGEPTPPRAAREAVPTLPSGNPWDDLPAASPPVWPVRYRHTSKPVYPARARKLRQEGMVVLSVWVDEAGTAARVTVKTSCGFRLLDEAAERGVRGWKFIPARVGDQVVGSEVEVPIEFKLEE